MKKRLLYLLVATFLVLCFASCQKEKVENNVSPTENRFDHGTAFGKHIIRETVVNPDGTKVDGFYKWDSIRLKSLFVISDSSHIICSFDYYGSRVSKITVDDGTYTDIYNVTYNGDYIRSVIFTINGKEYGMAFFYNNANNDVVEYVSLLNGNSASRYDLTWENGNLVKIKKGSSYIEYQYDDNPTQVHDIPSAYFLLGDVYSLVNLSVNNIVSAVIHSSEGIDTVSVSYNYTLDGYPSTAFFSDGSVGYYQYADGDGSIYANKVNSKMGGNIMHPQGGLNGSMILSRYETISSLIASTAGH